MLHFISVHFEPRIEIHAANQTRKQNQCLSCGARPCCRRNFLSFVAINFSILKLVTGTVYIYAYFFWIGGVTAQRSFSSPAAVLSHCAMNRQADLSVTQLLEAERNAVREHREPSDRVKQLDNDAVAALSPATVMRNPTKGELKCLNSINFESNSYKENTFPPLLLAK